jgi:hypothetical protein
MAVLSLLGAGRPLLRRDAVGRVLAPSGTGR